MREYDMITADFNQHHDDLQAYFKSFRGQKQNTARLSSFNLGVEVPEELRCPMTLDIMNIPVKVNTILGGITHAHYFDMKSIWACYVHFEDGVNYRVHPINRSHFTLEDILPAPEMQKKIQTFLDNLQSNELIHEALPAYTPKADSENAEAGHAVDTRPTKETFSKNSL